MSGTVKYNGLILYEADNSSYITFYTTNDGTFSISGYNPFYIKQRIEGLRGVPATEREIENWYDRFKDIKKPFYMKIIEVLEKSTEANEW